MSMLLELIALKREEKRGLDAQVDEINKSIWSLDSEISKLVVQQIKEGKMLAESQWYLSNRGSKFYLDGVDLRKFPKLYDLVGPTWHHHALELWRDENSWKKQIELRFDDNDITIVLDCSLKVATEFIKEWGVPVAFGIGERNRKGLAEYRSKLRQEIEEREKELHDIEMVMNDLTTSEASGG